MTLSGISKKAWREVAQESHPSFEDSVEEQKGNGLWSQTELAFYSAPAITSCGHLGLTVLYLAGLQWALNMIGDIKQWPHQRGEITGSSGS